jgi:general secretion pathway protein N
VTRGRIGLFAASFVLSLIVFMPLSMALSMFGLTELGLSARSASGTIWSGSLAETRVGRVPVGDLAVGLRPLSLLIGRARVDMQGPVGRGSLTSTTGGWSADDVTARLPTAGVFAPIPLDAVDLTALTVSFNGNLCAKATGRVRATFSADIGGIALAQGLSGAARCDGSALLIPLVSQSAMERLNLRIQGDGAYRAEFFVRSTDPALAAKLSAGGFSPAPGGFVSRLAGKL